MSDFAIEVIQNDITKVKLDAIVNAAHEALMGGGGVDGAIHRAAGPALLRACRAIPEVEKGVRCRPGEAFITAGYNLPAKYVIHTVAPRFVGSKHSSALMESLYKNAKPGTEKELADCYTSCLTLAAANRLQSVAFPSLGTGGHSFPIELACPIAVRTVSKYAKQNPRSSVEYVCFVCFSEEDLAVYSAELAKLAKEDVSLE
jgi:O-acetyl-ADP-ribose deacetylase (regulator of RNase III)